MAWIFSLAIECGEIPPAALARQFADSRLITDAGEEISIRTHCDEHWLQVVPQGLSESGIHSASEAALMTRTGEALLARLKSVRGYRYARVGVDVDRFAEYEEIDLHFAGPGFGGLVISDELWHRLGKPGSYQRFSADYHWQPYQGERFDIW